MTRRRRFTLREKDRILGEQERLELSNAELCRRYEIQNNQIIQWRTSLSRARYISKNKKSLHCGNRSKYHQHEEAISDYILARRGIMAIVNVRSIITKLAELCPESIENTYKSRQMWTYRFLRRRKFSIRRITRNITLDDTEMTRRRNSFFTEIEQRNRQYPNTIYVNMDQVAVVYGDAGRFTIDVRGSRSVPVRSGLSPSDRVTLALAIASNGEKLSTLAVFKGTPDGRVAREFSRVADPYPSDIYYATNRNAWMTEPIMLRWVDNILVPFALQHGPERICLILDSFHVHQAESVRVRLRDHRIATIYIPGGMTAELQPLDVGVNAPFKHYIRETVVNIVTFDQQSASQKRLSLARSISLAFSNITVDTVVNSFNRTLFITYCDIDDADEVY